MIGKTRRIATEERAFGQTHQEAQLSHHSGIGLIYATKFLAVLAFVSGVGRFLIRRRFVSIVGNHGGYGKVMLASPAKPANAEAQEKESRPANESTPLLNTVLEAGRKVPAPADDFIERTRGLDIDQFDRAFEKKVEGHSGFSAPWLHNQNG